MAKKVYVYDPTASDQLSRVRGIGRYLKLLRENFEKEFEFIDFKKSIDYDSTLINPFFNILSSPLLMRRYAKRQIAVIHDLIPLKYGSYFPVGIRGNMNIFFNRVALNNYDLFITDSEASKNDIVRILKVRPEKIKVIYPCLSKSFMTPDSDDQRQEVNLPDKYCVYVGDATWNKNLINIARAVKIINATCVFVGKVFGEKNTKHPWQKELKGFFEETKNDKRFIFPGFINDYQLLKIYQQASVNILVSRDEGFGFSYLEAASNSCPSLLSKIPVLEEISAGAATFADPENPNEIANAIGEIYFRRDIRNRLGRQAFKRSQFFGSEKFREEFLSSV